MGYRKAGIGQCRRPSVLHDDLLARLRRSGSQHGRMEGDLLLGSPSMGSSPGSSGSRGGVPVGVAGRRCPLGPRYRVARVRRTSAAGVDGAAADRGRRVVRGRARGVVAAAPVGASAAPSAQGPVLVPRPPGTRLRPRNHGDHHAPAAVDHLPPAADDPAGGRAQRLRQLLRQRLCRASAGVPDRTDAPSARVERRSGPRVSGPEELGWATAPIPIPTGLPPPCPRGRLGRCPGRRLGLRRSHRPARSRWSGRGHSRPAKLPTARRRGRRTRRTGPGTSSRRPGPSSPPSPAGAPCEAGDGRPTGAAGGRGRPGRPRCSRSRSTSAGPRRTGPAIPDQVPTTQAAAPRYSHPQQQQQQPPQPPPAGTATPAATVTAAPTAAGGGGRRRPAAQQQAAAVAAQQQAAPGRSAGLPPLAAQQQAALAAQQQGGVGGRAGQGAGQGGEAGRSAGGCRAPRERHLGPSWCP